MLLNWKSQINIVYQQSYIFYSFSSFETINFYQFPSKNQKVFSLKKLPTMQSNILVFYLA